MKGNGRKSGRKIRVREKRREGMEGKKKEAEEIREGKEGRERARWGEGRDRRAVYNERSEGTEGMHEK